MNLSTDSLLDRTILMLAEFSRGNFHIREEVTDDENPLNAVIAGLNMLGGELENFKREITYQRTFLQNILSSIDEVIYVRAIDIDNPKSSPFTFISGRSAEIIGLNAEELEREPENWSNAVHRYDVKLIVDTFRKVLNGQEVVATYRIYHPVQQKYRWIEDRISPKMNQEGKVTHIYGSE